MVEIMNRYSVNGIKYELHPDRLTKEELGMDTAIKPVKKKRKKSSNSEEKLDMQDSEKMV